MTVNISTTNVTDGSLVVDSENDVGKYTCFASNEFGTVVASTIQVEFAFLNQFNQTQIDGSTFYVNESDWLILPCRAPAGHPAPVISWTRNGYPLFANGSSWDPDHGLAQDGAGNLVFLRASLANNGTYRCIVQSTVTKKSIFSEEKTVVVRKVDATPWKPPQILESVRVVKASLGEDVKIYCLAIGNPAPNVSWTRSDDPSFHAEGPVLTLHSVQMRDEGTYTCTASSTNMADQTTSLRVEAAPYWIEKPRDTTIRKGETAEMSCIAGGKPTPNITWMENGESMPQYDGLSSIVVEDMKVYQCVATNDHGQIIANAILNVTGPRRPAPSGVIATVKSRESALISWQPINDTHLVRYKIFYKRKDRKKWKSKDCGRRTQCTLQGLKKDGKFDFYVVAEYDNGDKEGSREFSFNLQPKDLHRFEPPVLFSMFNTAFYCVIVLAVSTPIIMCVILCIRDQINGYDPESPTPSDAFAPAKPNPDPPEVKVETVPRQDGAGPSQPHAKYGKGTTSVAK
ncbi:contactin-2-like [Acanthaster planci]|uniref:Contactin-2-like n=1 Tax=Acanthaster planci TaxID=133434 RepID=A0A8B7ZJ46_ACAPL|nr:contactin-2-like [Acanthaster planci]